jgi:tyrosyl-tRNA synthetase
MHTVEEVLQWRGISVVDSLVATDLCKSKSDARRMIDQGAIRVDDMKVTDHSAVVLFSPDKTKHILVQIGA